MTAHRKSLARVLTVRRPRGAQATCLVADSPHSGRLYPEDFNHGCDPKILRQAEDAWIDKLFDFLPDLGVPFLQAKFPRSYIDANRDAGKVVADFNKAAARGEDPEFTPVEGGLIRSPVTPRHRVPVYDRKITLREAFNRVSNYHQPYHARLARMISGAAKARGQVVHLNCHSMPSTLHRGARRNKHDFILGTRDGETADPRLARKLKSLLEARGYTVGLNVQGFRGAEIVRRHGDPAAGRHSIQIEVNRALYMNENTLGRHRGMQKLKADLREALLEFRDYCDGLPLGPQAAGQPAPRRKSAKGPR